MYGRLPTIQQKKKGQAAKEEIIAINEGGHKLVTAESCGSSLPNDLASPPDIVKKHDDMENTRKKSKQMPIYFVSRALRGLEVNYTSMEKLVLALVHASKRLRRYFQAHPIVVITDQPIKNILSNPEVAGRMQKWSIQLGEFGIHYRPRISVKGQVLADFIVERPEEEDPDASAKEEEPLLAQWTLFTDGSSCVDGCGAGVILTKSEGIESR
ncbi:reverse transcriptase domain-containing protein [Tanacetum coccineum]